MLDHSKAQRKAGLQCRASVTSVEGLTNQVLGDFSEGLETPVQAIYLVTLLGFLVVGAYLVVRQVLIRRELEDAAKSLGDRIRSGNASSEVISIDKREIQSQYCFASCRSKDLQSRAPCISYHSSCALRQAWKLTDIHEFSRGILAEERSQPPLFLQETFELGVILLRKKLFTQAVKNLEKARKSWDGEPDELAQVTTC